MWVLKRLCEVSQAAGVDVIFHTAALPGAWGTYQSYFEANVISSRNIQSSKGARSNRVYVDPQCRPCDEAFGG